MIEFTFKGVEKVAQNLSEMGKQARQSAAAALYAEAQAIRLESMRRTPVDTGALRASHQVSFPVISVQEISTTIGVGGPSAPYAIFVHEITRLKHKVGRSKFLESALRDAFPRLAKNIADRMRFR